MTSDIGNARIERYLLDGRSRGGIFTLVHAVAFSGPGEIVVRTPWEDARGAFRARVRPGAEVCLAGNRRSARYGPATT